MAVPEKSRHSGRLLQDILLGVFTFEPDLVILEIGINDIPVTIGVTGFTRHLHLASGIIKSGHHMGKTVKATYSTEAPVLFAKIYPFFAARTPPAIFDSPANSPFISQKIQQFQKQWCIIRKNFQVHLLIMGSRNTIYCETLSKDRKTTQATISRLVGQHH